MEFEFVINKIKHKISLEKKEGYFFLRHQGKSFKVDIRTVTPHVLSLLVGDRSYIVYVAEDKDKKYISLGGELFIVQKPGEEVKRTDRGDDRLQKEKPVLTAPMPGKVIKVCVAENETVRKNQTLAIVEAMKMENELKSPIEGVVKKIFVSAGDLVDSEKPLLELEVRPSA